jgi:hypothetical protein
MVNYANPFKNSKAKDLNTDQINEYWVNYPGLNIAKEIIAPHVSKPIIIKGSKGTGKSHIFLYHSISIVKERPENKDKNLVELINDDGFVAVYIKMHSTLSHRFQGNEVDDKQWIIIFENYLNIYMAIKTLEQLKYLIEKTESIDQHLFIKQVNAKIMPSYGEDQLKSIDDLQRILIGILTEIDHNVNDSAMYLKIDPVSIPFNTSNLVTEMPKLLFDVIPSLGSNSHFIYLIDEIEDFSENQQRYLNTLIRSFSSPISIRLGTRLYGHKTDETLTSEIIKYGAEYMEIKLDDYYKIYSPEYKELCEQIVLKRLIAYKSIDKAPSPNDISSFFDSSFESGVTINKTTSKLKDRLKSNLKRVKLSNKEINDIVEPLQSDDIYIESEKIMYFYKLMSKLKSFVFVELVKVAHTVSDDNLDFVKYKGKWSKHIKQIVLNLHSKPLYSGFDCYVYLSGGIVRNLLDMLSETFDLSYSYREEPFQKNHKISLNSQSEGISTFSKWYYQDAIAMCKYPERTKQFIDRLGLFFHRNFYSEKPSEVETATFFYDENALLESQREVIEDATSHSLLVEIKPRRAKNAREEKKQYQLIVTLSPLWNLTHTRRSSVELTKLFISALFSDNIDDFSNYLKQRLGSCEFPFQTKGNGQFYTSPEQLTFL